MKKEYCDLHTHSVFSDGTWTPTELINEADRIGLSAIALTDHNSVGGVNEFFRAAEVKTWRRSVEWNFPPIMGKSSFIS